ncbi:hypothetical protein NEOLEDRAFT_267649 [Neolentinus lepideus HHB14362 ss-1]|uniref:CFEM domain-containing protein n=1 Tax=Neolentinus lepideus HHB14362 ss-1 TaxID=1314782 RepID=A0A165T372_9AGAM|nr:hypothetical protein NEOLEDRAFT_267649 [Neolentinus lepideus HHB14362 ss-1]
MRCTLAFVTLSYVFAVVSASRIAIYARQSLPSCATSCLMNADTGTCGENDTCLCRSQAFINSTTTCIQQSCTGSDLTNAEAAAQELCAAVGVTLSATSATASATAPASSASGSPGGSATTSASASSASASQTGTTSGAMTHGANMVAGLAAVGLAALAL